MELCVRSRALRRCSIQTVTMAKAKSSRKETAAKAKGISKAKRVAPALAVNIGSTPATRFRGNPDIFGQLVLDHDRHRALIAMIEETHGNSAVRKKLFTELTREVKAHAAARKLFGPACFATRRRQRMRVTQLPNTNRLMTSWLTSQPATWPPQAGCDALRS